MKKVNKQYLLDTLPPPPPPPPPPTVRKSEKLTFWQVIVQTSRPCCHFIKKYFFPNQTPSCISSMCLHCKGKVSNCSIKSCGTSRSAHEGTIHAYTKALLAKASHIRENCLSSHSCHFVKNYFFSTRLLHAYVQCVYIV